MTDNNDKKQHSKADKATAVFLSYILATGVPYATSRTPEFMGVKPRKNTPDSTALPHVNEEHPLLSKIKEVKAARTEAGRNRS